MLHAGGEEQPLHDLHHRHPRNTGHLHWGSRFLSDLQLPADARDPRAIPPRDPITLQAHETGVGESGRVPNTVKPRFKRKIRQPDFVS